MICLQHGNTALVSAAMSGHTDIVQCLVNSKADANVEDKVSGTFNDHAFQILIVPTVAFHVVVFAGWHVSPLMGVTLWIH